MNTEVTVVVINCTMVKTEEIEEVEAIILRVTREITVLSKNEIETITKNDHKNLYQKLELKNLTLFKAFKRHTVIHLIECSCQLKE